MDWREFGCRLQKEFEQSSAQRMRPGDALPDFVSQLDIALFEAAQGNPARIIRYFRSEEPLPANFREDLALYFEGFFHLPRRGRGQPKHVLEHIAADTAQWFFNKWREENERNGVNDYHHRSEMRDKCIEIVIENDPMLAACELAKVRDLLNRPARRRK